jgi:hypothetical protein
MRLSPPTQPDDPDAAHRARKANHQHLTERIEHPFALNNHLQQWIAAGLPGSKRRDSRNPSQYAALIPALRARVTIDGFKYTQVLNAGFPNYSALL